MKTFEELDCWKKAVALRKKLSLIVKTFPLGEKFRLIHQILEPRHLLLQPSLKGLEGFTTRSTFSIVGGVEAMK